MPCSDGGPSREIYENEKDYGLAVTYDQLSRQVACEMAKIILRNGLDSELSTVAKKWLLNHDFLDKKREKKD